MGFWTKTAAWPARKYQFLIANDAGEDNQWWWAKSVTLPSYDINISEHQIGNHKVKYPGILSWNEVDITIVDVNMKSRDLFYNVLQMGYEIPTEYNTGAAIDKQNDSSIKQIEIRQFNPLGEVTQTWTLYNVMFSSVDFGSLSYSEDELVEATLKISYDYAVID